MQDFKPGPDNRDLREKVYSLIPFETTSSILDIGCGTGYDLVRFGERCGPGAALTGIDSSIKALTVAREKTRDDPRFTIIHHDLSTGLPFPDEQFDLVYSANLMECITDKAGLIDEVCRVLRPNGRVVFSHIDWDTQVINGPDKNLIRRMVAAFSDWKQGWMDASDGWMGRRLNGVFARHGGFDGMITPIVLVNTEYTPELYGSRRIADFSTMADKGLISREDYTAFISGLETTRENGDYFYSVTLYVYCGQKISRCD